MSDRDRWNPRPFLERSAAEIVEAVTMRDLARRLGEVPGVEVPAKRVAKGRRDYTVAELREMADNAAAGIPPASSPAAHEIRRATLAGDFERANALTREVKEKAPALARLARAAERAAKRAKRRAHVHVCNTEQCSEEGMGPCKCSCGAVLEMGPTYSVDGRWAWHLPDGSWAPFPDPRE